MKMSDGMFQNKHTKRLFIFFHFVFLFLPKMTECVKRGGSEQGSTERKETRISQEEKVRTSFYEIKVVSLCEALRISEICDDCVKDVNEE